MSIELVSAADVSAYLGLGGSFDTTGLASICAGLSGAVKRYCRWQIVETDYTVFLPKTDQALGIHVPTANLWSNRGTATGSRNKLQLPSPFVTAVAHVYEDQSALGGQGSSDFASTTELTSGEQYFLEADSGNETMSNGGFLVRVGCNWSSIPGSIRVDFTSGFDEGVLSGDRYELRFRLTQRAAEIFFARKKMTAAMVSGIGGDTSGLLRSEKLGDWGASYADPLSGMGAEGSGNGMVNDSLGEFLTDCGYTFENVSV